MPPRARQYVCDAADAFGVTAAEIAGKQPGRVDEHMRTVARARRAVWQRLSDDGFKQSQIARWFGRHPSTVCVQVDGGRLA